MADRPGYRLKVERADKHLGELKGRCKSFLGSKPHVLRREYDEEAQTLSFWITVQEVPKPIAIALGDCLHNLRSALDHIIYAFGEGFPGHRPAFPVLQDERDWDTRDKSGRPQPKSGAYKVWSLPAEAQAFVKGLQPYGGDDGGYLMRKAREELLALHQLDIRDKHRELNLALTEIHSVGYYGGYSAEIVSEGPFEPETETRLIRVRGPDMEMNPHAVLAVVLWEPDAPRLELVKLGQLLTRRVIWIIDRLEPSIGHVAPPHRGPGRGVTSH